ncbi:PilZ domain-containing protein [Parathalassolituus penaei]|uniref:Cyclic diguanosine monophosphate-binding protein n=1 Tax=Parathalassolituus penaei TaxID=2997323 RepID=A0A9X3EBX5_9GAMM|nr:PilZ domain-containing protein [Parathalassolituus penaei]MCY0964758.1 PilZ domain-containing protein [Parathalassolituus penaei]
MNQRRFTRVPFLRRARIETRGYQMDAQCLDISARGVLLVRPPEVDWALEQHIRITIVITERESILMDCSVAHIDDDVVGCACDSMDLESLTVLRRVLELNLPDSVSIHRELAELIRSDKY